MRLDDLQDDTCPWCGKGFTARKISQKYCSRECAYQSALSFAREITRTKIAKLRCEHCGGPIPNAKKTDARFCCVACLRAARKIRLDGRLSEIRCVDCGKPVKGIKRRDAKRCAHCLRLEHRRATRDHARRKRAMSRSMSRGAADGVGKPL